MFAAMFGIGPIELLIIGVVLAIAAVCVGGFVALLIRALQAPKKCPHCGADLRR